MLLWEQTLEGFVLDGSYDFPPDYADLLAVADNTGSPGGSGQSALLRRRHDGADARALVSQTQSGGGGTSA
jgi:hypothetical protein